MFQMKTDKFFILMIIQINDKITAPIGFFFRYLWTLELRIKEVLGFHLEGN